MSKTLGLTVVIIFLVSIISLILISSTQSVRPVLLPSDVSAALEGKRVRIAGRVADDKIGYEVTPSFLLTFKVVDPDSDRQVPLPVAYSDVRPDMFAVGRDVIVDGILEEGTIVASHLMTQCPSKYEAPSVEGQMGKDSGLENE